jgi:hypothetical protein
LRKVTHRLAANEVVLQLAGHDQLHVLRRHAFFVHRVCADQAPAFKGLQARRVLDIEKIRQNARMKARRERTVGARLGAELGPRGCNSARDRSSYGVGAGVCAHPDRFHQLLEAAKPV